jgi:hypothetical protein
MAKTNKSAGGVGESKQFNAPVGSFEDRPEMQVDGQSIPPHLRHALPSRYSDEGMEEFESRPKAFSETLADAFDKQLHRRADFLRTEMEPWEAPDARKELANAHTPAGHVPRFLSDNVVNQHGLRGWKPVKTENGDSVKLGNMTLASMPKEVVARRKKAMAGRTADAIGQIYQDQVEQIAKDAHLAGIRVATNSEVGFARQSGELG